MIRLFAEYADEAQLVAAAAQLHERGYRKVETYTPYPLPAVDDALGARPSRLPIAVFIAGLVMGGATYWFQWLITHVLYPLDVGNRPTNFPLSFVPITFEMTVLFAAFTAVGAVIVLGRLLRLWDPIFEVDGFESATATRFWLAVDGGDPVFDRDRTTDELTRSGAARVVVQEERA
ncbi:MAG TPA: DUF3341 domain-containing protein [Kofleriaceae bacterium]|jgi:hypothetical protein|nr:DUF3341 domain-containing protein [Kofleriaceae bacterium]